MPIPILKRATPRSTAWPATWHATWSLQSWKTSDEPRAVPPAYSQGTARAGFLITWTGVVSTRHLPPRPGGENFGSGGSRQRSIAARYGNQYARRHPG